jgi:RNA polymerase sigma-70 factor (ECF subfamily)
MKGRARASLSLVVGQPSDPVSDREVAAGLMHGEVWAISEAWNRYAPMVLVTAERTLGTKADAEDLTQDVFFRVLRNIKTLRQPEKLRSFVYSVAVRTLRSHLRRRRFRSWISFEAPETLVDLAHCTLDVESRDVLRRLYLLLDRLSARDRLVFMLRRVEAMTVEEIAATMDLSVSTVKRSMQHASTRLSRWVDADPGLSAFLEGGQSQ